MASWTRSGAQLACQAASYTNSSASASSTVQSGTLIVGGGIGCGGDIWANLFQSVSANLVNTPAATQTAWQTITGDGVNWLDGTYTICSDYYGSNATPVRGCIQMSNGANSTSSDAMFIGTMSNCDLRFGTADSTRMIIFGGASAGRVAIKATTSSYGLYVATTASTTLDAGSTGVAYLKKSGGLVSTTGPISSVPISIACAGSMLSSSAYYTYRDRRLRHWFEPVEYSFAVGGVLFQVVEGVERPVVYTSRKKKSAELNYPTQQQELLAIVHELTALRIYCLDKPPIVETDHKRVQGLFAQKMANRILARCLAISEVTGDSELVARIKKSYKKDRDAQTILTVLKRRKSDSRPKREHQHQKKYRCYSEANDLLWYQTPGDDVPRIVVPNDVKLRQTIISHRAQGGQTEHMNRTLEEYLGCFVGPLQDDWDIHLANAGFAVNSTVNSSTKLAPFEADLGYIPLKSLQLAYEKLAIVPKSRRGAEFHERQATILFRCCEALAQGQERTRDVCDRNRVERVFEVGDKIYLSTQNLDPKVHEEFLKANTQQGKVIGENAATNELCNQTLEIFVGAYGREAGNAMLKYLPRRWFLHHGRPGAEEPGLLHEEGHFPECDVRQGPSESLDFDLLCDLDPSALGSRWAWKASCSSSAVRDVNTARVDRIADLSRSRPYLQDKVPSRNDRNDPPIWAATTSTLLGNRLPGLVIHLTVLGRAPVFGRHATRISWLGCCSDESTTNVVATPAATAAPGHDLIMSGDCGGTNTRLALWNIPKGSKYTKGDIAPGEMLFSKKYLNEQYGSFNEVCHLFLNEAKLVDEVPAACVLACAGPILKNTVDFTNVEAGWKIDGASLEKELGIKTLLRTRPLPWPPSALALALASAS
ncbi:hypothetical protein ON010_g7133 [Phytophthora cinnamomi]|nr:hypothetical protein ON010_g7133 [Phytophthora cinnamomi]